MNAHRGNRPSGDRRSFLLSSGGFLTGAWLAANWPALRAAAHEAEQAAASGDASLKFLKAADAADVEAIAAQIVPSGATPGAREAHAVYFIDRALTSFFAAQAGEFQHGLADFQGRCRASHPQRAFASLPPEDQLGFLKTVDRTGFFEAVRTLTLLGMFTSPKYGGNYQGLGWKLMGFEDRHAFTPPFGYYDRDYPGFEIAGSKAS